MRAQVSILPPIFPDEAIGFYVLRVRALSGNRSYRDVTRALFGQSLDHVDWALPCHLETFAESTAVLTQGADADYWMHKHTLLPYYAATANSFLLEALRSRMRGRHIGPMRHWHALTASELAHRHARYCYVCAAEDLATLGVRYVRTFHLLPNVSYCAVHSTPLLTVDAAALLGHTLVSPPTQLVNLSTEDAPELRFSKESFRLLREGIESFGGREDYLDSLRESGWWNGAKFLRRAKLREWIREFWRGDYLDKCLQELTLTNAGHARILGCFGAKRRLVHPVAAILVRAACEAQPLAIQRSVASTRDDYQQRLGLALAAFDAGASLTQSAYEANVSVTSLATAAEASGRPVKRRPKRVTPALVERVKKRVARGELPSNIAQEERVSLSSVYRVRKTHLASLAGVLQSKHAAAVQQRRKFWQANLTFHPGMTIKSMRALMPATYAWLYRHDRDWLLAQNSTPRPYGPTRRLYKRTHGHDLTVVLNATATSLLRSHGRPVRLTAALVLRSAGLSYVRRGQMANVPVDTSRSFVERRIQWARKVLANDGTEHIAWRVFRKTGLRRKTWESVGL